MYERYDSPEMDEARRYCVDDLPALLADETSLKAVAAGTLDPRLTLLTAFFTEIGALVVDRFIDDRVINRLGPSIARCWAVVAPLAEEIRISRPEPVWAREERSPISQMVSITARG